MKLDPECVRNVLLAAEKCEIDQWLEFSSLCEMLPQHTSDDVRYTCVKLEEAGYLNCTLQRYYGSPTPKVLSVNDITYKGHEFLNTTRSSAVWRKIQPVLKQVGVSSLPVILEIAKEAAVFMISAQLQSPS